MSIRGRRKFIPGKGRMNGPIGNGPSFKKPHLGRLPPKMPRYPSTTAAAEAYVADYMRSMQHQLPPMPYAPPPGFPPMLEALPPPLPRYYDGLPGIPEYHPSSMSSMSSNQPRPPPPPSFFDKRFVDKSLDRHSISKSQARNNDYNHRDKERNINSDRSGQKRKLERSGSDWNSRGGDNKRNNYRTRR